MAETGERGDTDREERDLRLRKMEAEIANIQAATENLEALTKKAITESQWYPIIALSGAAAAIYALLRFVF